MAKQVDEGAQERLLAALTSDYTQADLDPADRVMLDYAVLLTVKPFEVSAEDISRLEGNGFKDRAVHDICAIASYFLIMVGRKLGYKMTLVEGVAFEDCFDEDDGLSCLRQLMNHCWVEYDGKIIDLSAKQFDMDLKRVHVVDIGDKDYVPVDRNNVVRKNLKSGDWPSDQSPYSYITELRKRANKLSISLA